MDMGVKIMVTCDTGFEEVLLSELKDLVALEVLGVYSGRIFIEVPVGEDIANVLRSRIANNLYVLIHVEENIADLSAIYRVIRGLDFTKVVEPWQTFAIRPERVGQHSFTSVDIGRVAGQAVIDGYLEACGSRLKVDLDNPDVEIYVELNVDRLVVALSLTRSSFHVRGYKVFAHPAGLKPTIAFALLKIANWSYGEPVVDPMCGGGTIVVEAALASKGLEVPCLSMKKMHLGILNKLYPEAVEVLKSMCEYGVREVDRVFVGVDINPRFIEGAIINAKNAGVDDAVLFLVGDSRHVVPKIKSVEKEFGVVFDTAVFNPPYGYRMKPGSLRELYMGILKMLLDQGFKNIVFITSATKVSEKVLENFSGVDIYRLKVIHGKLPSRVYRLRV